MLPWLRDRPITMVRYPDGLGGQRFFQKNAPAYFPDWIRRVEVAKEGGTVEHASATSPPTWCTWPTRPASRFMRSPAARTNSTHPTRWCSTSIHRTTSLFADVRRAALWARDLLDDELGLPSFVRTSGGRGLHVHVPLTRRAGFDAVREFARRAADVLARRHPDVITTEQRKDKRASGSTPTSCVTPTRRRSRPTTGPGPARAPVATPLSWAEVEDDTLGPGKFTIVTMRTRLGGGNDPWTDFDGSRLPLGRGGEPPRQTGRLSIGRSRRMCGHAADPLVCEPVPAGSDSRISTGGEAW